MKKNILFILLMFFCFSLLGCATVKDKFTRKPKNAKEQKEIFEAADEIYPNDTAYYNNFIYWNSWEGELISGIGKSNKKVLGCADRALYSLTQMHKLLKPEKQKELKPYLDELSMITNELHKGKIFEPRQKKIIKILNQHMWSVQRDFDSDKMKTGDWIGED